MAFDYKKEYKEFYLPKNHPEIVEIPEMNFIAVRGKGDPNEEGGAYKEAIGLLYGIAFTIKMSKKGSHRIDGYFDYVVPPLEGFWWQEDTMQVSVEQSAAAQASVERSGVAQESVAQASVEHSGVTQDSAAQASVEHSGVAQDSAAQVSVEQSDVAQTGAVQPGIGEQRAWGMDYGRKQDFCWISVIRLPDFVTEEDFRWAVAEAERKKQQDYSKVEYLTIKEGLCVQCMHIGSYDAEPATVALMDKFLQENGYENDFSAERLHHEIYLSDARRVAPERRKTVIRHPVKRPE